MANFEEDIIARIIDYYVDNKHQKDYETGIKDALEKLGTDKEANELDKDIHAYEQGYNELMDKIGKLFLENAQFDISNILLLTNIALSVLAVLTSIIAIGISLDNFNNGYDCLIVFYVTVTVVPVICAICGLIYKSKKGREMICKRIAVYIRQYEKSLKEESLDKNED